MRLENDPRSIARQIARNAGGTRNLFVRMVPLFAKDVAARILFAKLGETMLSGFISNLGTLRLPPGITAHIEGVAFRAGAEHDHPYKRICTFVER